MSFSHTRSLVDGRQPQISAFSAYVGLRRPTAFESLEYLVVLRYVSRWLRPLISLETRLIEVPAPDQFGVRSRDRAARVDSDVSGGAGRSRRHLNAGRNDRSRLEERRAWRRARPARFATGAGTVLPEWKTPTCRRARAVLGGTAIPRRPVAAAWQATFSPPSAAKIKLIHREDR